MTKKVGTVLKEDILESAKAYCKEHRTPFNRLVENALSEYLQKQKKGKSRFSTIDASFGVFKLPLKAIKEILQEDIYET